MCRDSDRSPFFVYVIEAWAIAATLGPALFVKFFLA